MTPQKSMVTEDLTPSVGLHHPDAADLVTTAEGNPIDPEFMKSTSLSYSQFLELFGRDAAP